MSNAANNGLGDRGTIVSRLAVPDAEMRITMPARPENVALIRHVLGALADGLGVADSVVDDIRLAVTEACANVVRHAYANGDGTIEVAVTPGPDAVTVVVVDHGRGLAPSPDTAGPGLGLSLIATLTDKLEIEHGPDGGSRVAMSFGHRSNGKAEW